MDPQKRLYYVDDAIVFHRQQLTPALDTEASRFGQTRPKGVVLRFAVFAMKLRVVCDRFVEISDLCWCLFT